MNKKVGILITNLGTPASPTTRVLRSYLKEFLSDPRVVEIPRPIWLPILYGLILPFRPQRSAKLYQKIWLPEGSPLLINSQKLKDELERQLISKETVIALGMRYGQPSLAHALQELRQAQCDKIIILPLFPQYSAATTASTFDAVANILKNWRAIPQLRMVTHYYNNPLYISAIANSIQQHWQQHGQQEHLLFSFHGLPQRCVELGDPYQQQCLTTAQLVAEQLKLAEEKWTVVFQSRFGRAPWLQPYCDKTLQSMPANGIKSVCIICPGFAVDCLETLEEINQLNRGLFLQAGGKEFHYIPCLNESNAQVDLLRDIILTNF